MLHLIFNKDYAVKTTITSNSYMTISVYLQVEDRHTSYKTKHKHFLTIM